MAFFKSELEAEPFAPESIQIKHECAVQRASVTTCTLLGVEAIPVQVEIEVSVGEIPSWTVVGMGDAAVREAKARVKAGLKAAGFKVRADRKVLINLAPASMRKTGSGFDLPMAIAYLLATGQVDPQMFQGTLIVGELSIEGSVRAIDGLFAHALCAKKLGYKLLSGPANMKLPHIEGLEHLCLSHLTVLHNEGPAPVQILKDLKPNNELDFSQVVGQELALRALTIAAAGGHGVLMIGPPGAG